jgi:hypothetical protein
LDAAIQTTPTRDAIRLPALPDEDATISPPPLKGCAAVAAAAAVGCLVLATFPVTFCAVSLATAVTVCWLSPGPHPDGGCLTGITVGLLAAVFAVILVVAILRRFGWR